MSLSSLIQHISQLAASPLDAAAIVERAGTLIVHSVAARRVFIRIWHEGDRSLGSFDSGQRRSATESRGGLFVFSRPINVRGVEYGWLDLELPAGSWPQAELQMAGEVLLDLFGQLAEKHALLARRERLRSEARDLGWQVKIDKLLSRATGLISAKRRINTRASIEWLREESMRLRLPLWRMAERLIEGETLVRNLHSGRPEDSWRQTA